MKKNNKQKETQAFFWFFAHLIVPLNKVLTF